MIPDGIYLNLPHAIYRADPALGSTDLKAILFNAVQWHGRNRNPATMALLNSTADADKMAKAAAGKAFGEALHTITLEGEAAFDERYCLDPTPPDLPKSREEMAQALRDAGVTPPPLGRSKDVFLDACKMNGVETAADWEYKRALIVGQRKVVSQHWDTMLRLTRRVLERHPVAMRYLSKGRAEVSVFYTDPDGHRYKVRFDYLHPRPVVDLKSYGYRDGREAIQTFTGATETLAYDFQAAGYMHVRQEVLPGLVGEGRVFDCRGETPTAEALADPVTLLPASAEDRAFMQKVGAASDPVWVWVAVMTGAVPEVDTVELPVGGPAAILQYQAAQHQVQIAKATYARFRERFGPNDDELWVAERGLIRLTDFNFGRNSADRGAVKYESDET